MIGYLFISSLEIFAYFYTFLKLRSDFTKYRLISFISFTNYFIFGITISAYITLLNLLVMYYAYIPCVTTFAYSKIKDTSYVSTIKKYYTTHNINSICKWIVIMGDLCTSVLHTIISSILIRVQSTHNDKEGKTQNEPDNNLDDFLIEDDEQFQKLNKELDNLLSLGTSIITQTMAGRKEEQRAKVGTFVSGINTLLGSKKTK